MIDPVFCAISAQNDAHSGLGLLSHLDGCEKMPLAAKAARGHLM